MKRRSVVVALVLVVGVACGDKAPKEEAPSAAAQVESRQASFTQADLDKFEQGLRQEIAAVKAAQAKAASAATAEARGVAIQAQWDTATVPLGATASGLTENRYREVRDVVDRVFTTLDFQEKINGPMSIDLDRADADTKARVSGDAFIGLPAETATALPARMDRLVPVWIEYKTLVAVAG
jgi:hypothetical protein